MCAYHLERGGQQLIIFLIPLIATVSMAVVTDFRSWKIPNKLVAVGLIQGFVVSAVVRGLPEGLLSSAKGCVIPVVILYVLFLIFSVRPVNLPFKILFFGNFTGG